MTNDKKPTNARIMNALGMTQMHAIKIAKEDRENFLSKALQATVQFVQEVVDEKNAKLCKAFLEAFANAAKTHLERQEGVLDTIPELTAEAIKDLGLSEECVKDLSEDGDEQPLPDLDDILANIKTGIVIDPETGETRTIDADEVREMLKRRKDEGENKN